jgi:LysR family transcriptional regulator, hydrogen peroxide-inducible genes activator
VTITLRQLRYATALAETGHFGRAAKACHVTQPALSQQIRQLEELCGASLFDREAKPVRPTPFGREMLARAREVLQGADGLDAFIDGHVGVPSHPLRFGLIPTVAPYLLPLVFPALRREHPSIRFVVSENRTEALLDRLGEGTLDLALIATEPPPGGLKLTVRSLFEDGFVLAASDADPVIEPVQLAGLDTSRLLLLDDGHCLRDQALAACRLGPDRAPRTFAATSLSTIVEFVANGQGVTLLPEIALRKEGSDRRIHIRPIASPGAGRTLRLVWRDATPFRALFEAVALTIAETHRPAQVA